MPLNLLKKYNELLDIIALPEDLRYSSLRKVFDRDISNNPVFSFQGKLIKPTPKDGIISMETLFSHLTTEEVDKTTKKRAYEYHRSARIHWVKHHIDQKKNTNIMVFSIREPEGFRTYIYDKDEKYVVVLEPKRAVNEYYLLTAFFVRGKDAARKKYERKYNLRLPEIL